MLYVGKAQSLRSRVRSYWQKQAPSARGGYHQIREAIDRVADLEVTEVDSVSEALLLEANLIKRFKPRFNVRLKDDKSYPYIKITLGDDFPRDRADPEAARTTASRYFGPYASASSVDEAMNLVRRLFPFRTCTIDIREGKRALPRPCLLYHIKRCQGPCIEAIDRAAYRRDIAQVELFLEGNADTLLEGLRHEMHVASEGEQYEKAAVVRDKIRSIERTMESQKMAAFARTELDLVALARKDDQAAVQLFVVRNGKMLGRDVFFLEAHHDVPDDEVLGQFLHQYYARATSIPREVLVPAFRRPTPRTSRRSSRPARGRACGSGPPSAARSASSWSSRAATRPSRSPARPPAGSPTRAGRWGRSRSWRRPSAWPARRCGSSATTSRNFQGAESVGSMVVFEEGRPRTGEYRRFQIRTVEGANDFASHQEVLRRRFRRAKPGEEGIEEERRWAMPDLVIVDGGRGQVSAAKEVLDELGLGDLPLAGLAKEREELVLPDRAEPVVLPVTSQALYLVQRLRDEAHRFAITYHRNLRASGRSGRPSTTCPAWARSAAGAAQGVRLGEAGPRGAGGADRGRPGIGRSLAERIKAHLEA